MPDILGFVIFTFVILALVSGLKSPRLRGAAGERRVRHALRKLPSEEYHLFNDVTLPTRRGTTQVDHVLLSRFGVFVIETKNMSGWIFGSADQAKWTQVLRRQKRQFQNPLRQNYAHVKAIEQILELPPSAVHSLVAFTGEARPKTLLPDNVVWSGKALLASIRSRQVEILTAHQVKNLAETLEAVRLPDTRKTQKDHVRQLRQRHG